MLQRVFGPLTRRWGWARTALRVQERFAEIHGSYLASSITLSAFLSLFPLLLVTIAVIGFFSATTDGVPAQVISTLGLTGQAATAVTNAIATAEESRAAASVIGLAGLLWSGLGLVAAIQFAFDAAWQVSGRGLKDKLFGLAWLGGAAMIFTATFVVSALINLLPWFMSPVAIVVGIGLNIGLWLWTMHTLVNRDVGWRPLLPGAVLAALGLEVLKLVGGVYVPRAVASSSALYGSLGVVFAILAWLLFFGRLVVYAAVLNVVRWEEDHGTVTVELEVPNLPGEVPVTASRAGEAQAS